MKRLRGLARLFLVVCSCLLVVSSLQANLGNLEKMVRKNPNDVRLQFLLGKAYSQQGKHLQAKKVFQEVLQRRKAPVVFLHLGLELAAMGNITGAILQWTSVIEQKPNNMTAMRLLARALHKQALQLSNERDQADLFEQSLGWWKRILHLDPGNLRARYFAGIECYKLGKYDQAAKHFLILLRVKKTNRKCLKALAKTLVKMNRPKKARRVATRILSLERQMGRTAYTSWAKNLVKLIDSGSIKEKEVRDKTSILTRTEEDVDEIKKTLTPITPRHIREFTEPTQKPQPPKPVKPDDLPGSDIPPKDEKGNIEAENLFLDGLDFMDQGKYEKALFCFLQSIDINPNFIQVYLQMGECYIRLARLAKRKSQFSERLALANSSLKKVQEKSPGSLVAHAAQSKLVMYEKLTRSGFKGYHIMTAHKAIKEHREDDAFDEYILLLSNLIIEPGVFLEFGTIVPTISKSNLQDLQYFTEDLYQKNPNHAWIEYLLAKIYDKLGQKDPAEAAVKRFLEHFDPKDDTATFAMFVKFVDHPKVHNLDRYLCVRFLLKIGKKKEAASLLKVFLSKASKDSLFFKEASLLADQLRRSSRTSQSTQVTFAEEVKELQRKVEPARVLFDHENLSPSHLDKKLLKSLELFIDEAPENTLGRFVYAWVLGEQAKAAPAETAADMRKKSEEIFHEVLGEKTSSSEWHFKMGIQSLWWHLKDKAMAHLKLVGDIDLARGIPNSSLHCNNLLIEAEFFESQGKHDIASALLRQAKNYSPRSLNYYLVRAWFEYRRGSPIAAIGQLIDWCAQAISQQWVRKIVFCEVGLLLFIAVLLTILATATALTIKYFEMLHHVFAEFIAAKGAILTLGLTAMAAIFLVSFATGLVIFLPAILWPLMNDRERFAYLALGTMLLLIPLLLPVSFFENFELIKQVENVRSGALDEAKPFFSKQAEEHDLDFGLNYANGLICLREGRLDDAQKIFTKLLKQGEHEGVLLNLGVIAARKGEYKKATEDYFQKVLSIEAKSIPALYNMSAVHSFQGQQDKAEQYMRWAKALATEEHQLSRYRAIPSTVAKLVLMDAPLDVEHFSSHFSFFSTANFFKLNANLIGFITWFVIGGGLIGFLLYLRERMDIVAGRCSQCYVATCNLCQQIIDSKAFCDDCADKKEKGDVTVEELKRERKEAAKDMRDFFVKKAYITGVLLPGTGPLFTGEAVISIICQLGFWFMLQAALGGWLLSVAFSQGPGADALSFFSWLFWVGTLFFFLVGVALLHRRKEGIEWI